MFKHKKYNIYSWLFVFYIYMSLLPSNSVYVTIMPIFRNILWGLICVLSFLLFSSQIVKCKIQLKIFAGVFILTNLLTYYWQGMFLSDDILYLIHFSLIYIFFCLPNYIRVSIYRKFVIFGAFFVSLSLIEYLFHLMGINYYLASAIERGEGSGIIYSHGLFNIYPLYEFPPRFQGLFREPGFLGTCSALVLFNYNNFSKKIYLPWLVGGLFSLSLFFYVLLVLILLYHVFYTKTISLHNNLWLISLVFLVLVVGFSVLQEAIFDRVDLYLKEGDNRVTSTFNYEFSHLWNSSQYLYGKGYKLFMKNDYSWGNAGVKAEIYKYGVINVFLFIFGFFVMLFVEKTRKTEKVIMFGIYLLCFYTVDCKYSIHIYILILSLYSHLNLVRYVQ